jgi:hypothetical protein
VCVITATGTNVECQEGVAPYPPKEEHRGYSVKLSVLLVEPLRWMSL